ncbi:MAG TPA: hypothetical protein VGC41_21795 [Kofleriaceae bacterium]
MVDRWDRLARGLLTTAIVFAVFGAYELGIDHDKVGAAMALVPAALFVGLWRLAIYLGDRL